jgi:hypothetical protein
MLLKGESFGTVARDESDAKSFPLNEYISVQLILFGRS